MPRIGRFKIASFCDPQSRRHEDRVSGDASSGPGCDLVHSSLGAVGTALFGLPSCCAANAAASPTFLLPRTAKSLSSGGFYERVARPYVRRVTRE
jgi:hypothetical protein